MKDFQDFFKVILPITEYGNANTFILFVVLLIAIYFSYRVTRHTLPLIEGPDNKIQWDNLGIKCLIVLGIVALVFALTWLIKWMTLWPWWCFIILGGVLIVGLNLLIKYWK